MSGRTEVCQDLTQVCTENAEVCQNDSEVCQNDSADKLRQLLTKTRGADAAAEMLGEANALCSWRRLQRAVESSGVATATATVTTRPQWPPPQ